MKKVILSVAIATVFSVYVSSDAEAWIFSRNNATTRSEITSGFGTNAVTESEQVYKALSNAYSKLKTLVSKKDALVKLVKSYASSIPNLEAAIEGSKGLTTDKKLLDLLTTAMKDVYQCERYDVMHPKIDKALAAANDLFLGVQYVSILINTPYDSITKNQEKIEKAKSALITAYQDFVSALSAVTLPTAIQSITDASPLMIRKVALLFETIYRLKGVVLGQPLQTAAYPAVQPVYSYQPSYQVSPVVSQIPVSNYGQAVAPVQSYQAPAPVYTPTRGRRY
jgi:hypothetical protein